MKKSGGMDGMERIEIAKVLADLRNTQKKQLPSAAGSRAFGIPKRLGLLI